MKTVNKNLNKIESLQGLRAFGFLFICSGHCTLTKLGALGVSIFFILSGFLLVYRNIEKEVQHSIPACIQFSYYKIKKLYPLHILTMLAVILYIFAMQNIIQWEMILDNILLIQSWIPDMGVYFSLNGVAWYLSACVFIYAMFPLVLSFIRKTGNHSFMFIVGIYLLQIIIGIGIHHAANTIFVNTPDIVHWLTYICPMFRIGDFIIGGYFGYLFANTKSKQAHSSIVSSAVFIAIALLILIQFMCERSISIWKYEFFKNTLGYTPVVAVLVFLIALEKGIVSKCLTWRPLVHLGDISAYTFLIHCAAIPYLRTILVGILNLTINPLLLFILTLTITCFCSEIYIIFEKMYLQRKRNYTFKLKQKRDIF